jgi:hypothetical protein
VTARAGLRVHHFGAAGFAKQLHVSATVKAPAEN